jgi:hypothetical protein
MLRGNITPISPIEILVNAVTVQVKHYFTSPITRQIRS